MEEAGDHQAGTRRDDEVNDSADVLAHEQRHRQYETRHRQYASEVFHLAAQSEKPPVRAPVTLTSSFMPGAISAASSST
jgi:hypothetical protein